MPHSRKDDRIAHGRPARAGACRTLHSVSQFIMPEYRECWMHFRHAQYLFERYPHYDWTVRNLWADLTEKESRIYQEEKDVGVLEILRADCPLTRGGGSKDKCSPRVAQSEAGTPLLSDPEEEDEEEEETIPGDHAHLSLWPPQFKSEDRSRQFATDKLQSELRLNGFRWSPRAIVADFGTLLMQVGPLPWVE